MFYSSVKSKEILVKENMAALENQEISKRVQSIKVGFFACPVLATTKLALFWEAHSVNMCQQFDQTHCINVHVLRETIRRKAEGV